MKNAGGQAQSAIRTIHFGKFWLDMAGSIFCGMPASAYARLDPQSDTIQACLSNPWNYVHCSEGVLDMIPIPWHSKGSLLWSLSTAFSFAPLVHRQMSLEVRCELAMTGYVLWDLWHMMGAQREAEQGALVGSMTMARETVTNLQGLCLSLLTIAVGKEAACLKQAEHSCVLGPNLFRHFLRACMQ